jgi:hypothetical protein
LDKFCTDKRLMSLEAVPRQVTWLIILKATVKATPVDADGQGSTDQLVGLGLRIQRGA